GGVGGIDRTSPVLRSRRRTLGLATDDGKEPDMRHDAIIIGSGFGGAVLACRLAEKGLRVLVLERGRRWGMRPGESRFPRAPGDPWLWSERHPEKFNGW